MTSKDIIVFLIGALAGWMASYFRWLQKQRRLRAQGAILREKLEKNFGVKGFDDPPENQQN